jgi:hypothetical protein
LFLKEFAAPQEAVHSIGYEVRARLGYQSHYTNGEAVGVEPVAFLYAIEGRHDVSSCETRSDATVRGEPG